MASTDRRQLIAWSEVLDLNVVQAVANRINQRWNLGVGFVSAGGALVRSEEAERYATQRRTCELLRTHPERGSRCRDVGAAIAHYARRMINGSDGGAKDSFVYACHAGLYEVVAPIFVEGTLAGFVLAGGYVSLENGGRGAIEKRVARFGIESSELGLAIDETPALGADDERLLRELVTLLAQEIASFQQSAGNGERRLGRVELTRPTRYCYGDLIGDSAPMFEMYRLLDKVIDSDSTVLIQGENGTGKELIAKAIHFNSWRKDRRFVVQNCSAFNDNLLDSELFGHKKGAFTGAFSDKHGLFEVADGSTFFLDEIGEMSPALQVKLLRVLQEGTFIPVGDTQPKKVDVRIIAATNRDLKQMVANGSFREDLYYRINVINIPIPPLRQRREDIPVLIEHFLKKQARGNRGRGKRLSKPCVEHLLAYNWAGNVRELENEIERLVVLSGEDRLIGEELLSARIRQFNPESDFQPSGPADCLPDAVRSLERNMIYEVLKRNHWNKTRAAQELRISRRNLIRKVNKYKLDQRGAGADRDALEPPRPR